MLEIAKNAGALIDHKMSSSKQITFINMFYLFCNKYKII